jgi:hypothetical protein
MKRLLLPASALVLVLTACGAGAKTAPRVAEVGAHVPSVRVIAARRERAALREAQRLLGEFVPPPRARPISQPRHYGGVLRQSGPAPLGETVDAHRFWRVRRPLRAVTAFLRTHRMHGFEPSGTSWGSRKPHYLIMSSRGAAADLYLNVTSVGLPARTLIRVDVQIGWTYPRSPSERVPSGTSEIVLHAPRASVRVTDPAQVALLIRWFDALPISPPGIAVMCPLEAAPDITLSFRSARGDRLAQAKLPSTSADICDPIAYRIAGRDRKPLIDRPEGESFVRRLERLLHVQLLETHL